MDKSNINSLQLKIDIIGDTNVGKTHIINQYAGQTRPLSYTNGFIDFLIKQIKIVNISFIDKYVLIIYLYKYINLQNFINQHDKDIKLYIWDNYRSQRLRQMSTKYYEKSKGIIFVYDTTSRISFENILKWINDYFQFREKNQSILALIGSKCDLDINRQVSYHEGQQLAESLGFLFFETSALTNYNIDIIFDLLINEILEKL